MAHYWRLDDGQQTLVLASVQGRLAEVAYWGANLPEDENLETLYNAQIADVTGGMLDANPAISICPIAGDAFPGQPGLIARNSNGVVLRPSFALDHVEEDANAIALIYKDRTLGLTYKARFAIHSDSGVIAAEAQLDSDAPIYVDWLTAPVVPASQRADGMIDYSGRWCGEFLANEVPWVPGIRARNNLTGRTGHEHFPGLVIPCRGATYSQGDVYALHYGWSGGHQMLAEQFPDGRRQVQFGHSVGSRHMAATSFKTAPLYMTFSDQGRNGCAVAFQRHVREGIVRLPDPERVRPVHYNCWEAVYFDHKVSELQEIADRAAELGAERFVLDDGWFGKRDDDTSSLGDWVIDARKYPDGLGPLIDHVNQLGMTFGIWFEPEMINPNSDTYRLHPNWVLGSSDQTLGRQQMVLNMALQDVQDYLFTRMAAVFEAYDIDYVKWDHNRVLPFADDAQTEGIYALLDRLRGAFPMIEFESCASGGGRIDFGILERTGRVWLSDSNDAIERLHIQREAAQFLPAFVTGSHVGPRVCHTSGRTLSMSFRAWVAAQRHMGFEMDPRELSDDEARILRDVTTWWKANRDWMMRADLLQLESHDPSILAELHMAGDQSRFVVFAGKARTSDAILPKALCLTGLDPDSFYQVELINRDEAVRLSRGTPVLKDGPLTLSGRYLMQSGLTLPWSFPESMWVIEGKQV